MVDRPVIKGKIHLTEKYKRTRVQSPKKFDPRSFRTKDVGKKDGTKIIVACPKGKYDPKKKKCKVGTQTQSILEERNNPNEETKSVKELSANDKLALRSSLRTREEVMKEWADSPHKWQQKQGKEEIKKIKQVRKKLGLIP